MVAGHNIVWSDVVQRLRYPQGEGQDVLRDFLLTEGTPEGRRPAASRVLGQGLARMTFGFQSSQD